MADNKPVVQAIFKRDVRSWFGNPAGYVFITLFVFLAAFALIGPAQFFQNNLASLDTLNAWYRVLLLFFIPAVTMGIWASERGNGTDELLFTLPATDRQILLGKYFAAAGVYTVALAFTFLLPAGLFLLGSPDFGLLVTNYIGYWLLGLLLIAVAMVGSQLTDNLTVSFILGALFCAVVVFSEDILSGLAPALGRDWSTYGPTAQFLELTRGVLSFSSLLLFVVLTAAFLYLNLLLLSRRKWRRGEAEGVHGSVRFAALLVIAVALAVFGLNQLPRLDATSEGIHSLSDDTRKLIAELDPQRPVYIQAFVSEEVPQEFVQTRRALLDLLREYDALGGAAVEVRVVPTERYSAAAREAEANFEIRPETRLAQEGSRARTYDLFMGLAFQCGTEEVVIPFMDRKMPVEYEITRSIRVAAATERRKVGVLKTDVDLFGSFDFQTMRQIPSWEIVRELELQYEVAQVNPDEDYPEDLDALLAPMASSLTQPQMDRLNSYIAAGHPTLLIDDPFPSSAPGTAPSDPKGGPQNPFMQQRQQPEPKGDFRGLLQGLDIVWPDTQIAWDGQNPHPELELTGPEVIFVADGPRSTEPFNPRERITAGLQEVVTIFGGHVREGANPTLAFVPLLKTSTLSGAIDKSEAFSFSPFGGQMLNPNRRHRIDGGEKVLAARVTGKQSETAEKPVDVIFVADLDMMGSMFFDFRRRGLGGTKIEFDNVTFLLNCVDELTGEGSFIELRKRRQRYRTLDTIEREQDHFNQEWLAEKDKAEQRAVEALARAQQRLDDRVAAVRENADLDARSQEIQIETIREVEQRRLDLAKAQIEDEKQRAIEAANARKLAQQQSIQQRYTALTLAWAPIPGILVGLLVFLRRRKREREIVPGNRFVMESKS